MAGQVVPRGCLTRTSAGTGSGNIRVGIRQGTLARVDLVSSSGVARSDLDVSAEPLGEATLNVTGRTGSGSALVTAAAS